MPHIGSVAGRDRIPLVVRHDLVSCLVRLARGLCGLKEIKGVQRYQTKRSGLEIVPRFARGSVLRLVILSSHPFLLGGNFPKKTTMARKSESRPTPSTWLRRFKNQPIENQYSHTRPSKHPSHPTRYKCHLLI